MSDAEEIPDGSELRKVKNKKNKKQKRKHADEDTTEGGDVAARVEAQTNECDNEKGSAVELVAKNGKSSGEDREEVEAEGCVAKKRKVQVRSGIMSSEPFSNLKVSELTMKAIGEMGFVNMTQDNKDIEKHRQQGCPLYEKLALVVGNSIAMRTITGTNTDMASDVQREEEDSTTMLEDVNLGRDTPSPFFTENEEAPEQSPSANPSTSSRRRKKPKMSTNDCFVFADTMKEIVAVLRDAIKSAEVIVDKDKLLETNWIKAISEIPNIPIKWKFCAPEWFDTPTKKQMFIQMTVEERYQWLQYCSCEM